MEGDHDRTEQRVEQPGNQPEEHPFRALRSTKIDREAGKDDLILTLSFDQDAKLRLCGDFADLPSVRSGLEKGMRMHVPRQLVGEDKVVCSDEGGRLIDADGSKYSFSDKHLAQCTARGVPEVQHCDLKPHLLHQIVSSPV